MGDLNPVLAAAGERAQRILDAFRSRFLAHLPDDARIEMERRIAMKSPRDLERMMAAADRQIAKARRKLEKIGRDNPKPGFIAAIATRSMAIEWEPEVQEEPQEETQ